jgi:hypothetical protein
MISGLFPMTMKSDQKWHVNEHIQAECTEGSPKIAHPNPDFFHLPGTLSGTMGTRGSMFVHRNE